MSRKLQMFIDNAKKMSAASPTPIKGGKKGEGGIKKGSLLSDELRRANFYGRAGEGRGERGGG